MTQQKRVKKKRWNSQIYKTKQRKKMKGIKQIHCREHKSSYRTRKKRGKEKQEIATEIERKQELKGNKDCKAL